MVQSLLKGKQIDVWIGPLLLIGEVFCICSGGFSGLILAQEGREVADVAAVAGAVAVPAARAMGASHVMPIELVPGACD